MLKVNERIRKAAVVFHCVKCKREVAPDGTYVDADGDERREDPFHGEVCRVCSPGWVSYATGVADPPDMRASMTCPWCSRTFRPERYAEGSIHECDGVCDIERVTVFLGHERAEGYAFEGIPYRSHWKEKKATDGVYGTYRRTFKVVGFGWRRSNGKPLVYLEPIRRHHGQHKDPAMSPERLLKAFERYWT